MPESLGCIRVGSTAREIDYEQWWITCSLERGYQVPIAALNRAAISFGTTHKAIKIFFRGVLVEVSIGCSPSDFFLEPPASLFVVHRSRVGGLEPIYQIGKMTLDIVTLIRYILGTVKNCESGWRS